MEATPEERLALSQQINRLEFEEYPAVAAAWMKAVGLRELRASARADSAAALVDRYERGDGTDVESQRAMIRLFLQEWLNCNVPENIGVWGLEVDEFRPISRDEALRAADEIVAACQGGPGAVPESPHAQTRAFLAAVRGAPVPDENPIPRLPSSAPWFGDVLFAHPRSVFFLHDSPGGPTVRFNLANPRIIGLAPDLVGMLWLE